MDLSSTTPRPSATIKDNQSCFDEKLAQEISKITWIGLVVNVILAILKGTGGILAGSRALLADAFHTLSDLASDMAILIGVRYWLAPPDTCHPYGHHKIETLITLGIGLALATVGLGLAYEAVVNLSQVLLSASEAKPLAVGLATWLALAAALISLICKETLYHWTLAQGRILGSSALIANAWHHRSDAFSSIPPALTIGGTLLGSHLGYDLWYLDPVGTIAVCLMLFQAAWEIIKPALANLIDTGANLKLCLAIEDVVLSTSGVHLTHKIRTRYISFDTVAVDLHILVDGQLSVTQGHDLATEVKNRILELKLEGISTEVVDVVIHVEPVA